MITLRYFVLTSIKKIMLFLHNWIVLCQLWPYVNNEKLLISRVLTVMAKLQKILFFLEKYLMYMLTQCFNLIMVHSQQPVVSLSMVIKCDSSRTSLFSFLISKLLPLRPRTAFLSTFAAKHSLCQERALTLFPCMQEQPKRSCHYHKCEYVWP